MSSSPESGREIAVLHEQRSVKAGQALSGSGEDSALNAKVAFAADVAVAAGLGVR